MVTDEPPLPIHGLLRLAEVAGVSLSHEQREQLREINTFNVEARYDDYKLKFYKKATKKYAEMWFSITKILLLWFKQN